MVFNKLSSSSIELLKWIAIAAMTIDHTAIMFFDNSEELRAVGRIAFPLFGFMLIHNFIYFTSNKKEYIKRLWIFAIISQPIFALTVSSDFNIFVLLATSLSIIYAFKEVGESDKSEGMKYFAYGFLLIFGGIASLLTGYGFLGFYFLVSLYFAFMSLYFGFISFILLMVMNHSNIYYTAGALSAVLLLFLVPKFSVCVPRTNKWFFYGFYPLHLLLLYGI